MTNAEQLNDYRWLLGEEAAGWLEWANFEAESTVRVARRLRESLSAFRVHLVLEQVELRRRARAKFEAAESMFFTSQGLEQATDQWIARYKASRFPGNSLVGDACCGIGGDLIGLAQSSQARGCDRDPRTALVAAANCRAVGLDEVSVTCLETSTAWLGDARAWHVDPDRRADGVRTAQFAGWQPTTTAIDQWRASQPAAAVKLAPATLPPEHWVAEAEREWIGSRGECRQQVAWFGDLARAPGRRSATIVPTDGRKPRTITQSDSPPVPVAASLQRFLLEPHNTILAAGLVNELAADAGLQSVPGGVAYLTSDEICEDVAVAAFEVLEVWPFDLKRLRSALRARDVGSLEIKKRGVDVDPPTLRKRLRLKGSKAFTLVVFPSGKGTVAVLARRTSPDGPA